VSTITIVRCCANCDGAIKLETAAGSACKYARSMPSGAWREWLDTPFEENACEYFNLLPQAELQRRAEIRARNSSRGGDSK
jgi:hypothetical protein